MRVGVVPILGAVALLLLLALRRHQPPARVIRKHQRHSRRAARNFFVGAPIDVAADADASSLRRVARLASHDRGRGPELSLICSDADGAAMALAPRCETGHLVAGDEAALAHEEHAGALRGGEATSMQIFVDVEGKTPFALCRVVQNASEVIFLHSKP